MAAKAGFSIEIEGYGAMKKRLKELEEMDAPEIAVALANSSRLAEGAVSSRAPRGMDGKVTTRPAKKLGASIVLGEVKHPGAKAMEFGRTTYYRGFTGRNQKGGSKFKASGQKPRPFVGIKHGDRAMAALEGPIRREITDAVVKVWNRPETD